MVTLIEKQKPDPAKRKRHEYPRRVPFDDGWNPGFGRVDELFGMEDNLFADYRVEKTLFWVKGESLVGKLIVGADQMELRADAKYQVIRFEETDATTHLPTGKYLFLLIHDLQQLRSFSTFFTDQADIEQVEPNWPEGVDFPEDGFVRKITSPHAKTLFVDMDALVRERGGDPTYKISKEIQWKRPKKI